MPNVTDNISFLFPCRIPIMGGGEERGVYYKNIERDKNPSEADRRITRVFVCASFRRKPRFKNNL